jgi:hypothetical protein
MRNMAKQLCLFAALWCSSAIAGAAEPVAPPDEITTDRPDYTESTDIVPRGLMQLESGLQTSSHRLDTGRALAVGAPFALMRLGLSERVELRFGSDGYLRESRPAASGVDWHSGAADAAVGAKFKLLEERRWLPALSVIGAVSLPVGSAYFSSAGRDPFVKLCFSKSLPRGLDMGVNANFRWNTGEEAEANERGLSLTFGHKLGRSLRGFWEVYQVTPIAADEPDHVVGSTGISRLIGRNVQVDVAVGHTLAARTPSWTLGVGLSVRMPMGLRP